MKKSRRSMSEKRKKTKFKFRYLFYAMVFTIAAISGFFIYNSVQNQRKENSYVATVNGEPISVKEFRQYMIQDSSYIYQYFKDKYGVDSNSKFWTSNYSGEIPIELARTRALDICKNVKVQQILLKQKGIVKDISYSALLKNMNEENENRAAAVKKSQVIYGPVQFNEETYFTYIFENSIIKLKEELKNKEIKLTEDNLKAYYETNKDRLYRNNEKIKIEKIYVSFSDEQGLVDMSKKKEALKRIRELKAQLDKGENFDELVKRYEPEKNIVITDEQVFDETTIRKDIGSVLKEEAQKMEVNQISDIIETSNSYSIIKCIEKSAKAYMPYNEVKDNVEKGLMDIKYKEMVDKLEKEVKVEVDKDIYNWVNIEL